MKISNLPTQNRQTSVKMSRVLWVGVGP